MSESKVETKENGKKSWFSDTNAIIITIMLSNLALTVALVGIVLAGYLDLSAGITSNGMRIDKTNERIDKTNELIVQINSDLGTRIDNTNKRIDEVNKRIDETNKRIFDLQNLFAGLSVEFGNLKSNDENQDKLYEQQVEENEKVDERLSKLESAQTGESQ